MDIGDDTAQAPETSAVDCPTHAADPTQLAWSLDDGSDEPQRQSWRSVFGVVAVIGVCGAMIAGVLVWVAGLSHPTIAGHPTTAPPTQAAPAPGSTFAVPPPAPPSTVTQTVTAAPPTTTSLSPQDRDTRFVALMSAQGLAPQYMDRIVEAAHGICDQIARGEYTKRSSVARMLNNVAIDPQEYAPITLDQATFFVNTLVDTYCPQYNND